MADIAVNTSVRVVHRSSRIQVWKDINTVYVFFIDQADSDLKYQKSTDGGQTYGSEITIRTGDLTEVDVWFDKWTPGDSGTKIHIAYIDHTPDDVFYRSLDTSGDSLGTETTIFAGASTDLAQSRVSITKTRGGNLVCVYDLDNGTELGAAKSTDGGGSWNAITTPFEGVGGDYCRVFPGNEADNQDIWAIYIDGSANELSLKVYDDSGNSWAETSVDASFTDVSVSSFGWQFSGSVRLSDNHLIIAYANARDVATADLKVVDINGATSITTKTNVITDADDWFNPIIFINQNNDDLYVAYIGKSDGSETLGTSTGIYYKKSTDDGGNWGSETPFSAVTTYPTLDLYCDMGCSSGRFAPIWLDTGLGDLFSNYDNSVVVGSISILPSPIVIPIIIPAPTISISQTISPSPVAIPIFIPTPTILMQGTSIIKTWKSAWEPLWV